MLDWRPTRQCCYSILYVGKLNHRQLELTVTRQPHPVWWSQYHESIYRYKALTKNSSEYHCQKCLRCMVTLIMIDNKQSLLLGEVHCRSQEKWGGKNDFRMQSGTLGERQTKKVLLFCMSLPELCAAHQ